MNRNQCYNCGGDLRERDGRLVCAHCGTYMPEQISSEEVMLLTSACQKLRLADFSEAEQEFEDIVFRHPKCAQGYWGRLLAKYGIKYEEDYDGSRIPTCYAASIESVYDSSDYKKALEYADEENRAVFREHAAYIERVRLEWVEKASKEPPYDIFISYKDSDREHGIKRTQDSYTMQDLYFQLKEKGYRVFFSYESLRDKTGEKYEPYIYGALSTAKVMLVYGSKPEYINATWVKNEWTRYKKRMQAGEKKNGSLLVAYEGFAPKELPGALASLQCLNAGEKRFYTDLFAAIERILGEDLTADIPASVSESGDICDHTPMTIPGKKPTCTEDGWSESAVCTRCGKMLKPVQVLSAQGHRFGAWTVAKPATCTEDGLHERVCACGEKETKIIPARGGHVPGSWETVREASVGADGLKAQTCILCGERIGEETIPALPAQKSVSSACPDCGNPLAADGICRCCGYTTKKTKTAQGKRKTGDSFENSSVTPSAGLSYQPYADGKTCKITGLGTCTDQNLIIPDTVDGYRVGRIDNGAFENCEDLVSAVIPDTVTAIGSGAFGDCYALESLTVGKAVRTIGKRAFANCENLKSVALPATVTEIGEDAFAGCWALQSIDIPRSVKSLAPGILEGCANLRSFTVPDGVTEIGSGAFLESGLETVTLPVSVIKIGSGAFAGCEDLKRIRYRGTLDQWDRIALGEDWNEPCADVETKTKASQWLAYVKNDDGKTCTVKGQGKCKDTEIVIPEKLGGYTVSAIGDWAFSFGGADSNDLITSAVIPDTVKTIGKYAFHSFITDSSTPKLKSVSLGASVVKIGEHAFMNCKNLTNVTIPASVMSIEACAFAGTGSVHVAPANPCYTSLSGNLYTKGFHKFVHYAADKTETAFTLSLITSEILPYAFLDAKRLETVTLSPAVKTIGEYAFLHCENLKTVIFTGTKKQWKQISLDKDWRYGSAIRRIECTDGAVKFLF